MRYFITGGTGFIGKHLINQLLAQGDQVVALVRKRANANQLAASGVEIIEGNITSKDSMRPGMTGVDGVFHLAAIYELGIRDKQLARKINVDGTRNVLELALELGVPKTVYTSTLAIYSDTHGQVIDEGYRFEGKHLSIYDQTKWEAHYEVADRLVEAGLPLVMVMPGAVYGPDDHSSVGESLENYIQGKQSFVPARTGLCWSHVEDIAHAHILAMQAGKPGESYIIAGPQHTMVEFFNIAEELSGIKTPPIKLPPWLLRFSSVLLGVIELIIPLSGTYSAEGLRVIAGTTYYGSNQKAKSELGYSPRSLKEGLKQTLDVMLAEEMG